MKHSEAVAAIEQMLPNGASLRNVRTVQHFSITDGDALLDPQGPAPGNYVMVETQIVLPAK
jgi:hypothetical protein